MSIDCTDGWPAPAKLNLFLHIVGRRSDGYHELQTVFQFLDHGDCLDFAPEEKGRLRCLHTLDGVAEADDLCLRAARLLQQESGCSEGAAITLHKRLPLGAGLGGGSSNAATVLVALNQLWRTGLTEDELAELGLRLGADVPVFVRGRAAWAEGIGERLAPVHLPRPWYLVLVPPVQVSTAALFAAPELIRDCRSIKIDDFLAGAGSNIFEAPVMRRYPEVERAFEWLGRRAEARMTGTGAALYSACVDEVRARRIAAQVPPQWSHFVARGLNTSPLRARMAQEKTDGA